MTTVGVVVNPLAGTDVRRLTGAASHVPDSAKVSFVRRAVVGAVEGGARRVLLSDDSRRIAARALERLDDGRADADVDVLDEPLSGDRLDTVAAATAMRKAGAGALVAFGGDGTNRDVVSGWPDAPLVAVSTGTNNVFPLPLDAGSAGLAAGLVASGAVALAAVARRAKRIDVRVTGAGPDVHDVAVVDVALVDGAFVGTRAVWRPEGVRAVLAAIATPASSGLSAIAGCAHPLDRWAPGGIHVRLGGAGAHRPVRVQLSPGAFATVPVERSSVVALDEVVEWSGPGVLALDGERTLVLRDGDEVTLIVRDGPLVIDVERALLAAAAVRRFDVGEDRRVD